MSSNLHARPGAPSARASTAYIAQAGVIAAAYAATSLFCMVVLRGLAWGPVQLRISEALTVLAMFSPAGVPGLTVGCALANLANVAVGGTGALGLLDVVFGSLATYMGARWMQRFQRRPLVALAGPVLANALVVPAYLPFVMMGLGFYAVPFTTIAIDGVWWAMYLFGVVSIGLGEGIVLYALGHPLYRRLLRTPIAQMLANGVKTRR